MSTDPDPPKPQRRWFSFSLRNLILFTMFAGVVFGLLGWTIREAMRPLHEKLEEHWSLTYVVPVVPEDVPERFKPHPQTKLYGWLREGETHLNLKDHYRGSHHYGWRSAILDWYLHEEFRLKSKRDIEIATIPSCLDAYWLGYSEARRQIEEKVDADRSREAEGIGP
ncbi:MAG: hypothetical protein N2C14_24650 [Planctomycetales bacterium]